MSRRFTYFLARAESDGGSTIWSKMETQPGEHVGASGKRQVRRAGGNRTQSGQATPNERTKKTQQYFGR